jgi:hypothetical protein
MKKQKSGFDIEKEGLTDLYNDTITKAKEATDSKTRQALSQEASELARQIRRIEEVQNNNKPKKFLGIFKR